MKNDPLLAVGTTKRFSVRIRPGGVIVIPRPIVLALGGDPTKILVEAKANRLMLERRRSPVEARLKKFKTKLAERLRQAALIERRKALATLAAQAQELDMGY